MLPPLITIMQQVMTLFWMNGSYTPVMSDDRKALHELIDQAPEEALPRLLAWLTRLVHPPGSSEEGGMITFFPTEPGTTTPEPT
ncbi:MAG TPA: hypothetical protein VM715_14015, partial [Candidatus Acidoferrum sp.]|nr:hypothetical protein [Candidatus Acidoferrum sp.]